MLAHSLVHVLSWKDIASIDHQNYLQTLEGHETWMIYKKCIGSLHIVVWHMRVSARSRD